MKIASEEYAYAVIDCWTFIQSLKRHDPDKSTICGIVSTGCRPPSIGWHGSPMVALAFKG